MSAPLSAEERVHLRKIATERRESGWLRLLDERDALERRAQAAEAERDRNAFHATRAEHIARGLAAERDDARAAVAVIQRARDEARQKAVDAMAAATLAQSERDEARARLEQALEALNAIAACDDGGCPDHPPDFSPEKVAALRSVLGGGP